MKYQVIETTITPQNIKRYPNRYDLTVFTYNQFEPPYLIVDGSHRIEALKRIFKKGKLKEFNVILIPSNVLGARTLQQRINFSLRLDQLLREKGIPTWVKKYDFEVKESISIQSLLGIDEEMDTAEIVSWSNKLIIDSGDPNARKMSIDEYEQSRKYNKN